MEIKEIINLTPHAINLVMGEKSMEISISGVIARCEEKKLEIDILEYNIKDIHGYNEKFIMPIVEKTLGKVFLIKGGSDQTEKFPEKRAGTIFIVSLPVAQKLKRNDVFAIGESIRNEKGQIIGCKSLSQILT